MSDRTTLAASGRYLRMPEVKEQTGLAKTTIYRLIREHSFPKPVRIASRAVAWRESAIEAWKAERQDLSDPH